jgi:hypothetical protein
MSNTDANATYIIIQQWKINHDKEIERLKEEHKKLIKILQNIYSSTSYLYMYEEPSSNICCIPNYLVSHNL